MTYLLLMFAVVVIGITLTVAAKQWKTMVQRELEADLLARGLEIQRAIQVYSATKKKARVIRGEIYPSSLEELTKPPKPFLRKAYQDPITRDEWDYIRGPKGRIKGVRSRSTATPVKQGNFPPELRHFEGLSRYQDWIFQYPNASSVQQTAPAKGKPGTAEPKGTPGSSSPASK
ncbi:MAG: hypothetical protein V3S25_08285 [Nitrospirales bacterium]